MWQGLDLALGEGVRVPARPSVVRVTLGKALNSPKSQCPHPSASEGCCDVEENARVPGSVGCMLWNSIGHMISV